MATSKVREVSATEARVRFGALVEQVETTGEPVVVERGGRAQAVALSAEEFERLAQAADPLGAWLDRVDRLREQIRAESDGRPWPDIAELIRESREERDAQILAGLL